MSCRVRLAAGRLAGVGQAQQLGVADPIPALPEGFTEADPTHDEVGSDMILGDAETEAREQFVS
jgi:hypothetical protein